MSDPARFLRPLSSPMTVGMLSLLLAGGVAAYAGVTTVMSLSMFCTGNPQQGANIANALVVAIFTAIFAALPVVVGRALDAPRFMAAVFSLAAACLGVAVVLVALDSATYVQQGDTCGFVTAGGPTESARLDYLYVAWGLALMALLVQAVRLVRAAAPRDTCHPHFAPAQAPKG